MGAVWPPSRACQEHSDPPANRGLGYREYGTQLVLLQLRYQSIPSRHSARPAAGSPGVIDKLHFGILPAKFLNVFGMWHMLAIPKAVAHEGAL